MNCEEFEKHLFDYLNDILSDMKIKRAMEEHYFECDECFNNLELTSAMIGAIKTEGIDNLFQYSENNEELLKSEYIKKMLNSSINNIIATTEKTTEILRKIAQNLTYPGLLLSPESLESVMGSSVKPPEQNIEFVPQTFPDSGGQFKFLDPNSAQKNLIQVRGFSIEQKWRFIFFAFGPEGEIIQKQTEPQKIDRTGPIELEVPPNTEVVFILTGHMNTLAELKKEFIHDEEKSKADKKPQFCLVIYGPGK